MFLRAFWSRVVPRWIRPYMILAVNRLVNSSRFFFAKFGRYGIWREDFWSCRVLLYWGLWSWAAAVKVRPARTTVIEPLRRLLKPMSLRSIQTGQLMWGVTWRFLKWLRGYTSKIIKAKSCLQWRPRLSNQRITARRTLSICAMTRNGMTAVV